MSSDKHLLQYTLLFIGLAVVFVPFIWLTHNYFYQSIAAATGSILFITWGLVHHMKEGRLHKSVIGEYIMFGFVVFFIIFTVLNLL